MRGLEVEEEVWGAAPPWATGTHQQYAAEHLAPRPAALGALEAAAIPLHRPHRARQLRFTTIINTRSTSDFQNQVVMGSRRAASLLAI